MSEPDSIPQPAPDNSLPQPRLQKEVRHELRTQLNQIIGYSDLLIDEAEQRELNDLVPDLQKIHAAGLRLLDLINEYVDPVARRAGDASDKAPIAQ
jgi:signal transduction histidine kinase